MSVEKFIISKESHPYTITSNKVIDGLKDHLELLGLYLYLSHLPPTWKFYKSKLSEKSKIGIKKLNKMIEMLSNCNLITVKQHRDKNGKFSHFDMCIKNGDYFKNIDLESYPQDNEEILPECQNSRTAETVRTVLTTYKLNIDKLNNNKNNIYCNNEPTDLLKTSIKTDSVLVKPIVKIPKTRNTTFPDNMQINEGHRKKSESFGIDADSEFDHFKEHHIARGNKFANWDMAFHTWIRNAQKYSSNKKITIQKHNELRSTVQFYENNPQDVANIVDKNREVALKSISEIMKKLNPAKYRAQNLESSCN